MQAVLRCRSASSESALRSASINITGFFKGFKDIVRHMPLLTRIFIGVMTIYTGLHLVRSPFQDSHKGTLQIGTSV
jgi:hypothetical protein